VKPAIFLKNNAKKILSVIALSATFVLFQNFSFDSRSSVNNWSCTSKLSSDYRRLLNQYDSNLDYSYGWDRRHKMDLFYHDDNRRRTPLVVFFHGGGFLKGDKCGVFSRYENEIKTLLRNKVAFASVNYRFLVKNDERGATRAFDDGQRAFNKLRAISRWRNIDSQNIVVGGTSAGSGIASSIAFNDSNSRYISGVMLFEAQSTYSTSGLATVYAAELRRANMNIEQALRRTSTSREILWHLKDVHGTNSSHKLFDHRTRTIANRLNLIRHIKTTSPSIYVENVEQPDRFEFKKSVAYHHRKHADAIAVAAQRKNLYVKKVAGERDRRTVNLSRERANFLNRVLR